ncbi:hypothetical protein [Methanothermobacter tenebrarum]|uniref:PsbP C-terminal domain-containing protein n=1 Tax=Methanothermobacter tenebrarum TaxID=680118 RepID=A0A328PBK9_9EURY|nr:hypothetical protein [Methanothermobacter tenebrarum]NPV64444.1 hypothetical protein [Methanobacteriaceae archaeon]RAO78483.1 hypothetical protein DPC56_07830 [Methanothermobacter tenebrarum]
MKRLLPIFILAIVAFGFGCTGTQEKTFSGDGVTFSYPQSWENLSVSDLETYLPTSEFGSAEIITYLGNDTEEFAVVKLTASSTGYVRSPSEWLQEMKSSIQESRIISTEENVTVAGYNAAIIQYTIGTGYVTIAHLKVNENLGYQVYYWSSQSDQTTFKKIIKSLKIS